MFVYSGCKMRKRVCKSISFFSRIKKIYTYCKSYKLKECRSKTEVKLCSYLSVYEEWTCSIFSIIPAVNFLSKALNHPGGELQWLNLTFWCLEKLRENPTSMPTFLCLDHCSCILLKYFVLSRENVFVPLPWYCLSCKIAQSKSTEWNY